MRNETKSYIIFIVQLIKDFLTNETSFSQFQNITYVSKHENRHFFFSRFFFFFSWNVETFSSLKMVVSLSRSTCEFLAVLISTCFINICLLLCVFMMTLDHNHNNKREEYPYSVFIFSKNKITHTKTYFIIYCKNIEQKEKEKVKNKKNAFNQNRENT